MEAVEEEDKVVSASSEESENQEAPQLHIEEDQAKATPEDGGEKEGTNNGKYNLHQAIALSSS